MIYYYNFKLIDKSEEDAKGLVIATVSTRRGGLFRAKHYHNIKIYRHPNSTWKYYDLKTRECENSSDLDELELQYILENRQ